MASKQKLLKIKDSQQPDYSLCFCIILKNFQAKINTQKFTPNSREMKPMLPSAEEVFQYISICWLFMVPQHYLGYYKYLR